MPVDEVRLLRRETVAEGTMAFWFSRPAGFGFRAGQSILLRLISPPETDAEGDGRTFTIASAPHEQELMIATRMRDTAFKRVLKSLPPGAALTIDGPDGEMALEDSPTRPAVFLAGGIGITPFRSMALHAAQRQLPPHRAHVRAAEVRATLERRDRLHPARSDRAPRRRADDRALLLRRPAGDDRGNARIARGDRRRRGGDALRGVLRLLRSSRARSTLHRDSPDEDFFRTLARATANKA
jgi:ferredoxin-NADP reductase